MNNLSDEFMSLFLGKSGDEKTNSRSLLKQDSVQSNQEDEDIIDDEKLHEYEQNDSYYLAKEKLVSLLKTYKSLLTNKKKKKSNAIVYSKDSIFNDMNADLMESETSYEYPKSDEEDENSGDEQDNESKKMILKELKSILMNSHASGDFSEDEDDGDELPNNLIVTQLPNELFANLDVKSQFESLFFSVDLNCKFCYFRIFKRCLIQYEDCASAILARFELDDYMFLNDRLRIFLTKPIKLKNTKPFLEPPKNNKTFLISPPSSPPIGWEQTHEDPPVVNYDLLAALSKLNPHEPCELIKSSDEMPGIIIYPCPDLIQTPDKNANRKYIPTRRPANDF